MLLSRASISEITTLRSSFERDVEMYAQAGIGGIGVWEMKLGDRSALDAAATVRAAGLRVTNLIPEGNSVYPTALSRAPVDPHERVSALLDRLEELAVLEPDALVLVTGVDDAKPRGDVRRECVSGLRRLAKRAASLGMRVVIEPMHESAALDYSFVTDLASATRLIDDVGETNASILYDTWHMGQGSESVNDVEQYVSRIGAVHLADVHEPTRSWADRAFPGEGSLPLRDIVAALEAGGYGGSYDVEVFSDDGTFGHRFPDSLWLLPEEECVARATAFVRQIL